MLSRTVLVLVLCFLFQTAFTKDYKITLDRTKARLGDKAYIIEKIIDAREFQANIGWVQKGLSNEKYAAKFSRPLEKEIKVFLNNNLKSSASAPKIGLIIEKLKIYEHTRPTSESAYANLKICFTLIENGEFFKLLRTSYQSEIRRVDVTKKHDENIAKVFSSCFSELGQIDLTNTSRFEKFKNMETLLEHLKSRDMINVEHYLKLPDGVYQTYEEVLNSDPSIVEPLKLDRKNRKFYKWDGTYEVHPRYESNGKKIKEAWGFKANDTLYIAIGHYYFPVEMNGDELYTYAYDLPLPSLETYNTNFNLGGAITGGLSGAENARAKRSRVIITIDPNSGRISRHEEHQP